MKLKTDANGNVVLQDGKPVYVKDDGTEITVDVPETFRNLAAARVEARDRRTKLEEAEAKLLAFGELDPVKAAEAVAALGNLSTKDAERETKFQERLNEANKSWQAKLDVAAADVKKRDEELDREVIGGSFARSKFLSTKGADGVTDFVQAYFGKNFKRKDGKILATDNAGNPIYSAKNPGEPAEFDEALEVLVNGHPNRAAILKATNTGGGGAPAAGATGASGKRTMTRSQWDAMPDHNAKAKAAREMEIVDG